MPVAPRHAAQLRALYERLFAHYGPQGWWPGQGDRDEIVISAVLVQNTTWTNTERALRRLHEVGACNLAAVAGLAHAQLAELIRPVGYFNVKARRLHATAAWFGAVCEFDLRRLERWRDDRLRAGLLSINGVGAETADDIMVYAFERRSFVIDAYTRRVMERHGFAAPGDSYDALQERWHAALPPRVRDYNEAHAVLVEVGKDFCGKSRPKCAECPLFVPEHFATKRAYAAAKRATE